MLSRRLSKLRVPERQLQNEGVYPYGLTLRNLAGMDPRKMRSYML